MKRPFSFLLLGTLIAALAAPAAAHAFGQGKLQRHWRVTAAETVWHGRYSNCDYGYYVELPKGAIAHSPKPPQPNHGAVMDLASPRSNRELVPHLRRSLSMNSTYDASGLSSLDSIAKKELSLMRQGKQNFRVLTEHPAHLAGLPGKLIQVSYAGSRGLAIVLEMIAYRPPGPHGLGGIVYRLKLRSTSTALDQDKRTFHALLAGFHLTPLPLGACRNE